MILPEDIVVYVASKKAIAPKLPLREALVTVAIECIYEQKKKKYENGGRKRVSLANILKRRRQTKKLQKCTLYSYETEAVLHESLSNYLEKYSGGGYGKNGGDTIGASTLSSLTMTKVLLSKADLQREKEASMEMEFLEMESFLPKDAPSLASSDVDDEMDDMTMSTFALIGEKTQEAPPGVIITKDDESSKKCWWYEESGRVSPLVFEDPKDEEDFRNDDEQEEIAVGFDKFTIKDSILDRDIDTHSQYTCDLSTIVDSTCALLCADGSLVLPENHDLRLNIERDEDMKSIERRQEEINAGSIAIDTMSHGGRSQGIFDARDTLFALLSNVKSRPEAIKKLLDEHPAAIKSTRGSDGKLPLHMVCSRKLPEAITAGNSNDLISLWIQELTSLRKLLKLVAWSHIEACGKFDRNGDLPCHLLGRRFMKWSTFLQTYIRQNTFGIIEYERMTTVSKILTECIDIVLRPISTKFSACSAAGKIGTVLPLHISIAFGGSTDIFRQLLETFPGGARKSFVSDLDEPSTPIALNDAIKEDQMLLRELLSNGGSLVRKRLQWPASIPFTFYENDITYRSDLLFCFNPSPSEMDEERIKRLEKMVKSEVRQEVGFRADRLSPAISSVWSWMCASYKIDQEELDKCDAAIDNILHNMKAIHVRKLAYDVSAADETAFDFARARVQRKLEEAMKSRNRDEIVPKNRARANKEKSINSASLQGNVAEICRSIFAIKEDSIPISFVIFPFMIESSNDGNGMLVAERNSALAVQFARFMMAQTSPEIILNSFDEKMISEDNLLMYQGRAKDASTLKKLYSEGGWLYFIDESSGIPIVRGESNKMYPIHIRNAPRQVEMLLPLMRLGMMLIRKSHRESLLSQIIVKSLNIESFRIPISSWPDTATKLIQCLKRSEANGDDVTTRETQALSDQLSKYYALTVDGDFWTEQLDWSQEISLLQLILESRGLTTRNVEHETGLRKIDTSDNKCIWTAISAQDEEASIYHETQQFGENDGDEVTSLAEMNAHKQQVIDSEEEDIEEIKDSLTKCLPEAKQQKKRYLDRDIENKLSALSDFLRDSNDEDFQWEKQALGNCLDDDDENSKASTFHTCQSDEELITSK